MTKDKDNTGIFIFTVVIGSILFMGVAFDLFSTNTTTVMQQQVVVLKWILAFLVLFVFAAIGFFIKTNHNLKSIRRVTDALIKK